jgi:hypothetical protein
MLFPKPNVAAENLRRAGGLVRPKGTAGLGAEPAHRPNKPAAEHAQRAKPAAAVRQRHQDNP